MAWIPSAIRKAALPGASRADAVATPVSQGVMQRLVQGVRYTLSGKIDPTMFFGPGQPLPPLGQDEARNRQFDYPFSINTQYQPRKDEQYNGPSFQQLRAMADGCDLVRLAIETRKDQMGRLEWVIKPKDVDQTTDDRCKAITDAFTSPDREHDWATWLRMLLEEVLVIDAPAVFPRMTRGGDVYSLDLMDGSMFKRVIDPTGRTPIAPDPAYQQIIKGLPAVDYTRDELLYMPRNPRVNRLYGYSPVEQIVMTINIALRRQLHKLQYYTEGSAPDLMIATPEDWNPDQIKMMQEYFDALLSGNTAERRRTRFVPGGMKPYNVKEGVLKDEYDEWLARIVCYAFSLPPTAFIKSVNRATAQSAQDVALEEGLAPLMQWVQGIMNIVIARWFKAPDLCFGWQQDAELDPLTKAQINQIYVTTKVVTPDEVRDDLGLEPLTPEQQELLNPPPPPMGGTHDADGNPVAPGGKPGTPAGPVVGGKGGKGGKGNPPEPEEKVAKGAVKKKHFHRSTVTAKAYRNPARQYAGY